MAAISPISVSPIPKTLIPTRTQKLPPTTSFRYPKPYSLSISSIRSPKTRAADFSSFSAIVGQDLHSDADESIGLDTLKRFIDINLGCWNGSFYQFDSLGNLTQKVSTKLAVGSYGEDELISLIQTLYIKQPPSSTSCSGDDDEPAWAEYKIKEINLFTVDKYQQGICFKIPDSRHVRDCVKQGVLGEDDSGEESPKNLKLPSRRPSIVCENCLYSQESDLRARAFHIMDPKGILDMLGIFLEERGNGKSFPPSIDISKDKTNRITPFLGKWKGRSVTKRSGVYGSTIAEANTVSLLEINDNDQLVQDISSTSTSGGGDVTTNVHWTGALSGNLATFEGGFQMTLLPGGMYMGYPSDIAKSVAESKSFHLEFCWLESPGKRQRLVRTYDMEGLAVSSTHFSETRV
ncbi:hypothetical protein CK203_090847 [Vitis vinifera]|uniref:Biogenesis factor required for ATP synthase 1-like C-terminal domain-containing protein n=1 Tax=Vitis vinifera TaxID=29760 RepID=A0A438D4V7_VITVI|nr:hypothetical protein CK203_090847 [Vitis vinifera]